MGHTICILESYLFHTGGSFLIFGGRDCLAFSSQHNQVGLENDVPVSTMYEFVRAGGFFHISYHIIPLSWILWRIILFVRTEDC